MVEGVKPDQRGEYIIRYNVHDNSGNTAEEITFATLMVDTQAPNIIWKYNSWRYESTGKKQTLQCAALASCKDNYDGPVTCSCARDDLTNEFDTCFLRNASLSITTHDFAGEILVHLLSDMTLYICFTTSRHFWARQQKQR